MVSIYNGAFCEKNYYLNVNYFRKNFHRYFYRVLNTPLYGVHPLLVSWNRYLSTEQSSL